VSVPHSTPAEPPTSGGESSGSPQDVDLAALLTAVRGDLYSHAACPSCYACLGGQAVYVACCGRLATPAPSVEDETRRPANACPQCVEKIESGAACPVCGYGPKGEQNRRTS
jgi:hypothetical protein